VKSTKTVKRAVAAALEAGELKNMISLRVLLKQQRDGTIGV